MFLLRNVHRKVLWETKNGYFVIAANTPFLEPTFFKGIGLLWNVYYLLKINISMELLNSIITSRTTSVLYLNLKRGRMCWNLSFVRLKVILCLSSFMQWFDEPCCPTWRNSISMSNQQVRSLVNDFLKLNGQPLASSLKRLNNERKDNWFSFHAAPRVSTNIYTKRAYIRVCIKPPRAKKQQHWLLRTSTHALLATFVSQKKRN